jgi:hypothetical protein
MHSAVVEGVGQLVAALISRCGGRVVASVDAVIMHLDSVLQMLLSQVLPQSCLVLHCIHIDKMKISLVIMTRLNSGACTLKRCKYPSE